MQKVVTCLGFNNQAEEAVDFYTSTIPNSKWLTRTRAGEGGPLPNGSLLAATFLLDGQEFLALNGGPPFTFSIGMSILIKCEAQAEIDHLWEKLSEGGQKGQCGWLTDKFGVSWQIVPRILPELLGDTDPRRAASVMQAMLKMTKLDIAKLMAAREQAVPAG
jgi:predicted 3-demethylubiquinone-9 3-methyltransferase (glyoxalase superfamily)